MKSFLLQIIKKKEKKKKKIITDNKKIEKIENVLNNLYRYYSFLCVCLKYVLKSPVLRNLHLIIL